MSEVHAAKTGGTSSVGAGASWSESLRGGWLNVLAPSLTLATTILGESLRLPGWLSGLAIVLIWFAGFGMLIRNQFARRQENADVFRAFWRTTLVGFALVAALMVVMYLRGQA